MKKIPIRIKKLLEDRTSGSSFIVLEFAKELNKWLKKNSFFNHKKAFADLLLVCNAIQKTHPDMANIQHFVRTFTQLLKKKEKGPLLDFLKNFISRKKAGATKIAAYLFGLLENKSKVLTISNSKTVQIILERLFSMGKSFEVFIGEARPQNEGILMASFLAKKNILTTLMTDNVLFQKIKDCDAVLSGADRIEKSFFVNKVGTHSLAILAKHWKKRFFLLCEEDKFISTAYAPKKIGSDKEIYPYKRANLKIFNPYFEKVPLHYVDYLITENGQISWNNQKFRVGK